MRFVLLGLISIVPAYGQPVSFGIKGGGVGTGGLDPYAQDTWEGKRYTFGAMVEFRLPSHLAGEVDALYKRAGQRSAGCAFTFCNVSSVRADVFEFPMLVKYRMARRVAATFVSAGVSYRWVRHGTGTGLGWRTGPVFSLDEVLDYTIHKSGFATPAENHVGAVAAVGVELRAHRLKLAPELRYTRWNARYWLS